MSIVLGCSSFRNEEIWIVFWLSSLLLSFVSETLSRGHQQSPLLDKEECRLCRKTLHKLGLYKSLVLPVLLYGINCTTPWKSDLGNLEKLQREAVRWIAGRNEPYENRLRLLNIFPLPMYMQMNDLLTLSKLTQAGRDDIEIPEINKVRGRSTELYTSRKVRLEKARKEFVFKNCRLANQIDNEINFMEPREMKNRILNDVEVC